MELRGIEAASVAFFAFSALGVVLQRACNCCTFSMSFSECGASAHPRSQARSGPFSLPPNAIPSDRDGGDAIGQVPGLAVLIVGSRKDSQTYVNMKKKKCEELGILSFGGCAPPHCHSRAPGGCRAVI